MLVHHRFQCRSRAIVEIWRRDAQAQQRGRVESESAEGAEALRGLQPGRAADRGRTADFELALGRVGREERPDLVEDRERVLPRVTDSSCGPLVARPASNGFTPTMTPPTTLKKPAPIGFSGNTASSPLAVAG